MLSRTAEYALRAVLLLARTGEGRAKPANEIADSLGVPRNYLSKTLNRLAKRGVLVSVRGPGGGYRLSKPASVMSVEEVVSEFDALGPTGVCVMGEAACNPEDPCEAHDRWQSWSRSVSRLMEDTTVADFLGSRTASGSPVLNGGADEAA